MVHLKSSRGHSRGVSTVLATTLIVAATAGCTAGTTFAGTISEPLPSVLRLSWAKAKWTKRGLVVSGQVQQVHCCAFVRGHIHVDARDAKGIVLASADVPWGDFNPRQLHSAWFDAVLPVRLGESATAIDIKLLAER